MKSIVLRDHEVKRLASSGSVLIWRRVRPSVKGCSVGVYYGGTGPVEPVNVQEDGDPWTDIKCPFGRTGETRWVKETWAPNYGDVRAGLVHYKADGTVVEKWWSAVRIPVWASRFCVTLTVSCRQIQSVTEEEAERSGADFGFWNPNRGVFDSPVDEDDESNSCFRDGFGFVVDSRHPGSWERNDWFWCIECKEVK